MDKAIDSRNISTEAIAKDTPSSIRRLLGEFCNYTTAHGLGRLSESKNIISRLAWSLFCIGASIMFVLQVYNLFLIYLSRPVSTVVKVEHESRAQFPAVTICNMNMLRAGELPDIYIKDILEAVNGSYWDEQTNNTTANASFWEDEFTFESSGEEYIIDEDDSVYFGSSAEEAKGLEYQIEEALLAKVAQENDSKLFSMGHQFKDFVFECSYRGYDCSNYTRYWHTFWDFRFGNCFTFNGGINDFGESQKVLHSFNTGPAGGLKLKLFIEQSQYIPELTHTAGARVVIHDQGQMPFPDNEGNDVLPSRSTSFAIRKTVIERVDPFGNGSCFSGADFKDSIYAKKFNTTYSRQACLNSCLAKKQITNCGCAEARFPTDADVCDRKNTSTASCLDILLRGLLSGKLNCEVICPTPCTEVIFRTSLSMGQWPSFGYEEILEQKVQDREVYTSEGDFGYYLSENFLEVRIFFEQLNFERVVERVSYKEVNLVADIGGQLGLWIGISVLTCCELLELILLIIQSVFKRMFSTNVIHVKPA